MKTLTCVCCGSEVTCPQMYNGLVYGYTCIKKVDPTRKATKIRFVPVEVIKEIARRKLLGGNVSGDMVSYKFRHDGKMLLRNVHPAQSIEIDGYMFFSEQVISGK